ncbi:MAG: hypothetical protein MUF83_10425 [Acidimicrobiales bacterium]|jgi:hypothetical protein|nr:hypothetical protein [Acidimicrobiales bacterium]
MRDLDLRAVVRGGLYALALCLPAGLLGNFVVDEQSGWQYLLFVVIVGALGFGGFTAARPQPQLALSAGALAAGGMAFALQGIGILTQLARGEEVTPLSLPFVTLLAACIGMLGGFLAYRRGTNGGTEQVTG